MGSLFRVDLRLRPEGFGRTIGPGVGGGAARAREGKEKLLCGGSAEPGNVLA